MTAVFLKLVNMSVTASWLVLAVIALRFLLKKAPKALHCALWILVAVRLVCPFSLESAFSLVPEREEVTLDSLRSEVTETVHTVDVIVPIDQVDIPSPTTAIVSNEGQTATRTTGTILPNLAAVWFAGMCLMLLYGVESYWRIHRKVAPSISIGDGIFLCDHIGSPFILGLIRPRIYLPSTLESRDADYVLAHERAHLKRKDHWWKPLGFLLLSVYWFNPVIWAAYILLCRDIELACDEKVVRDMNIPEKKAYSTALLNCSLPRHWVAACPLAFGEVGVKQRVKNVLNYKKPAFWFLLLAIAVCIIASICLLTDPKDTDTWDTSALTGIAEFSADTQEQVYTEFGSRNITFFDPQLIGNTLIVGCRYGDNQLGAAWFENMKDGFVIKDGRTFDEFYPTNTESVCALDFNTSDGFFRVYLCTDDTITATVTEPETPSDNIRYIPHALGSIPLVLNTSASSPTGMYLYEINDSRNYSDLFTNTEDITLIQEGEIFSVSDPDMVLQALDKITVRKLTLNRSRSEDRDKTNQIQLKKRLYLNFSWDYSHVWIDNGVKPTYSYRVNDPEKVRSIFETMKGDLETASVVSGSAATYWFDTPLAAEANAPLAGSTFPLPGAEEITLTYSDEENQISMNTDAGSEVIITGWPIQTCAFADLTGDGVDEVCCTVSEGFGMIDTRIRVYDCMTQTLYELEDRGVSNYELSIRLNRIIVTQTEYGTGNVLEVGLLSINDSGTGLSMVPLDNTFREKLDIKYSGVTHDNCSWDITALAHIDSNWDRYCYLVCYDFDSRFVSFFDPHVTGNDLIVGVRYGDDQLGAAWFEKIDGKYQYRQGYLTSDFSPSGETTIVTTENSYLVYLSDSESMTAVSREDQRIIVLNSIAENVDWNLPEEVLAENYNFFDPQYVGNSLFIGAQKGEKYRLLHFEKNDQGRYEYQDIYYFLPERILDDDTYLPVRRITTESGELHIVLITDETVIGIQYGTYMRLTQWPSILVLDPGESEKLHITFLEDLPTIIDISYDDSGTPSFEEPGLLSGNTTYLYYGFVSYYDGWNPPGSFSMTEPEIQQLVSILTALPDNAIRPCKEETMEPLYVELTLCTSSGERYAEQVNYTFTHMKDHILLTIQTAGEADRYFSIDNAPLEEFLASLCDSSREGASILLRKKGEQVTYSHGDVTIQLVPYWNWEYEIVEYTDDETPFGIRGRPIDHDSGWIFYSCWPGGFETDTQTSQTSQKTSWSITDDDGTEWTVDYIYHYPEDPVMITEHWRIWSSIEITSIPGNFAIINEGADSWYAEHSGEIGFSWDIHTFQTS